MVTAIIITAAVLVIITAILIVSNILSNVVNRPKVHPTEDMLSIMLKSKIITPEIVDSFEFEDFSIKSRYGYNLSGSVIRRKGAERTDEKNIAVVCHGYTACRPCSYGYTDILLKLGFTVVMYDHRNHGDSDKEFTTMGYFEKYDLQTVLDWCYEKFGSDIKIVTHGESMGAAIVLDILQIDNRPKCVIADCGYSSLMEQVKYLMKHYYHLPAWLFVPAARYMVKRRSGFDLRDVRPIDGVTNSGTPILFIHGTVDDFVPTFMSINMYNSRKEKSELYLCDGAKHAESYKTDNAEYEKRVKDFLDKYYFDE